MKRLKVFFLLILILTMSTTAYAQQYGFRNRRLIAIAVEADTLYGNGSALTGVSSQYTAKVNEGGGITKGQPVYISGATGNKPQVSLTDNTVSTKHEFAGLAAETKTNGQTILVLAGGELTGVDADGDGALTASDEAWVDGDLLYLSVTGYLTNVLPTSGAVDHIAFVSYNHGTNGEFIITSHKESYIAVASGEDIELRMGDTAGVNKVLFEDYNDVVVASLDSDGNFALNEGVTSYGTEVNSQPLYAIADEIDGILSDALAIYVWATPTTTEVDQSGEGHTATYVDVDADDWLRHGSVRSLHLEDNEYLTVADHNDWNFLSGGNDANVSFGGRAKFYADTNDKVLMSKWDDNGNQLQWLVFVDTDEKLTLRFYDESGGNTAYEGRVTDSAISAGWHDWAISYDEAQQGESASNGMLIYIDGQVVASSTSDGGGTYVDKEDLDELVAIAAFLDFDTPGANWIGEMSYMWVEQATLSAADVFTLWGVTRRYVDMNTGIADNDILEIDQTDAASGEYLRMTANGAETRSEAEFKADVNLEIGTDVQAYDADLATLAAPTNWRIFHSDGSAVITELALGANDTFLESNGTTAAPAFRTLTNSDVGLGNVDNVSINSWAGSSNIATTGTVTTGTWASNITLGDGEFITLPAPGGISDLTATGKRTTLTAGYTTAIGDIVFLDPADSKLTLTDCDFEASTGDVGVYVVLEVKSDTQACLVLIEGWMRDDSSYAFAAGKAVFIGNTAGEATTTQSTTTGDFLRIIGHAFNGDVFYFDPDGTWLEI